MLNVFEKAFINLVSVSPVIVCVGDFIELQTEMDVTLETTSIHDFSHNFAVCATCSLCVFPSKFIGTSVRALNRCFQRRLYLK